MNSRVLPIKLLNENHRSIEVVLIDLKFYFLVASNFQHVLFLTNSFMSLSSFQLLIHYSLQQIWETSKVCKPPEIALKNELDVAFKGDEMMILAILNHTHLQVSVFLCVFQLLNSVKKKLLKISLFSNLFVPLHCQNDMAIHKENPIAYITNLQ